MNLALTDEEAAALTQELHDTVENAKIGANRHLISVESGR
jgi:hypothetical protein